MAGLETDVEERIDELRDEMSEVINTINEAMEGMYRERKGSKVNWGNRKSETQSKALSQYEKWYNSAYPLISEYLPDREDDFKNRYNKVRLSLEVDIEFLRNYDVTGIGTLKYYISNGIELQLSLLESIKGRIKTEQVKARKRISKDITSDEIQKGKELIDDEHIRAAGVLAGVALERHLITLCENSEQELEFGYMDGITTLAHTLSDANEISKDDLRLLEYLSGIRNKCSHATDEDPEKREVERMLDEASDFIRGS